MHWVLWILSPEVNWLGCECGYSLPLCAKIKNKWSYTYTYTLPICLSGIDRYIITVCLYLAENYLCSSNILPLACDFTLRLEPLIAENLKKFQKNSYVHNLNIKQSIHDLPMTNSIPSKHYKEVYCKCIGSYSVICHLQLKVETVMHKYWSLH